MASLEVIAGSLVISGLMGVVAWQSSEEPEAWTQVVPGQPYRHEAHDAKRPVPFPVSFAVPFAWAVVIASLIRAAVIVLEIMNMQIVARVAYVDCASFPCADGPVDLGPSFDKVSAGLHAVYLIAMGALIGAFARWARDASTDVNQARNTAPLLASGALVVVLGVASLGNHFLWLLASVHLGVVLLGAALVAVARRAAGRVRPAEASPLSPAD